MPPPPHSLGDRRTFFFFPFDVRATVRFTKIDDVCTPSRRRCLDNGAVDDPAFLGQPPFRAARQDFFKPTTFSEAHVVPWDR